jgi:hypothetical protein
VVPNETARRLAPADATTRPDTDLMEPWPPGGGTARPVRPRNQFSKCSSLLTAISGPISDIPVMFSESLERLSMSRKGGEMNDATDDLHSNEVNREYWIYLRLAFLRDAKALRGKAQAIVERLAATTDDVPAQLVQEQQQFWNDAGGDNTWQRFYELEDVHYAMIEEIARGESAPDNATVFVMEFVRRVTGRAGVLMSFRRSSEKHCGRKKWQ